MHVVYSLVSLPTLVLQTFETVVPAERTKLSVIITDGSVKAHAQTHPGALVFYVGDLTVNTDIVGDATSSLLHVFIPDLSMLLLDDLESGAAGRVLDRMPTSVNQGVAYWKVSPLSSAWDHSENSASLEGLRSSQSYRTWTYVTVPATQNQTSRYASWHASSVTRS